jgi:hypothetical protein
MEDKNPLVSIENKGGRFKDQRQARGALARSGGRERSCSTGAYPLSREGVGRFLGAGDLALQPTWPSDQVAK